LTDDELMRAYTSDASPLSGEPPSMAFFPSTAEEVSKVLKWANERGVAVYPFGGGSSLVGSPLPEGGVILDTSLLLDFEVYPKDSLVLVGSGWRIDELNAKLKEYGLWFPVDPGSSSIATVGGAVSTNAGGIRAVKYGLTADHVRALEFVTPTGELVWSGPWAKKSSTWLRVHQLIVGSEGTLGVVTKALLTLSKLPSKRAAAILTFDDPREMGEAVVKLLDEKPSALEFMDPKTIRAVNSHPEAPMKLEPSYALLVEFDEEDAKEKSERVLEEYGGVVKEYEVLWKYRKLAGPSLTLVKGSRSDWDVAVPISALPDAIEYVYREAGDWDVAVFGHAGDGNLHVNLLHPPGTRWVEKAIEKARELVCGLCKEFRGTVSGEHGIGLLKLALLGCEVDENALALWRTIKLALDPNLILNPGKKIPL